MGAGTVAVGRTADAHRIRAKEHNHDGAATAAATLMQRTAVGFGQTEQHPTHQHPNLEEKLARLQAEISSSSRREKLDKQQQEGKTDSQGVGKEEERKEGNDTHTNKGKMEHNTQHNHIPRREDNLQISVRAPHGEEDRKASGKEVPLEPSPTIIKTATTKSGRSMLPFRVYGKEAIVWNVPSTTRGFPLLNRSGQLPAQLVGEELCHEQLGKSEIGSRTDATFLRRERHGNEHQQRSASNGNEGDKQRRTAENFNSHIVSEQLQIGLDEVGNTVHRSG